MNIRKRGSGTGAGTGARTRTGIGGNGPARHLALLAATALLSGTALAGCSPEAGPPDLSVRGAYIPLPAADDMAAGYLTLRNDGGTDDRLVKVTSPLTDDVTMHRTSGTAMERVNGFDIPAGGSLTLERGGNHLMFMELSGKPELGTKIEVGLEFAESEPMTIRIPVEPLNHRPPSGG